ncbi:MAG: BNR-4 repeat-containing protein [Phycisphaerae bacterium]|nr:BNR-4 repeat-containing protein [Phycisphaerae bacterium]
MLRSDFLGAVMVILLPAAMAMAAAAPDRDARAEHRPRAQGYHGIWYANQKTDDEYKYKYSGGLGTYPSNHLPMAYYAEKAQKTFFVYGGMAADGALSDQRSLLIMVSYFDHRTGMVPRPTLLMDKKTDDAHDNPTIQLDDKGHVWVFVAAHGTARPAYIFKSAEPYEIDSFQQIWETSFSYPEPWYIEGKGFLFLHTRYQEGRRLFCMTSADGVVWSEPKMLARVAQGHYQVSWRHKDKIGTAFNYHPVNGGLNARTNLYYMETRDFGQTWQTIGGEKLELPLTEVRNPALIQDFESVGQLVYLVDLNFDSRGFPIILFVTSRGWQPGPKHGPRKWTTARWVGKGWETNGLPLAGNNYDCGCLHVEEGNHWRLIGPMLAGRGKPAGPQPYNPGGELMMWTSDNTGRLWHSRYLTYKSPYNHNYVRRPVNAHPGFYAFWADGNPRQPSESRLYFADKEGQVFRLPPVMLEDFAKPELVPLETDTHPAPASAKAPAPTPAEK